MRGRGGLDPLLLGAQVRYRLAGAADALALAGAPALAAALADAVVADFVAVALADVHAGDPGPVRPLTAVALSVDALAGGRPLAKVLAGRTADARAARTAPGGAAVTDLGHRGGPLPERQGREPGRSVHDGAAKRVPAAQFPGCPLGHAADARIQTRSPPRPPHERYLPSRVRHGAPWPGHPYAG